MKVVEVGRDGRQARVGALDGVRGVALAAVVGFHAFPGLMPGGFFGVEVFFVLSGFLLGSLLLAEHARTGSIDLLSFARRRLRRIVPALWVLLAALVVVAPLVARSDVHRLPGDVAWSAGGLTNWHLVSDQSSYFGQLGRPPLVRHLWSVAVEVQFYVVCPFLVLWAARRRRRDAVAALALGAAASAALMGVVARSADPSRAYYGTDTRLGALLTGVLLALVLRPVPLCGRADAGGGTLRGVAGRTRLASLLGAAGAAALLLAFWRAGEGQRGLYPLGFLAVQAATAATITGAVAGAAAGRVLGMGPLRWLGQRSYGIYLWHWPLVALMRPGIDVSWSPATGGLVGIAGAVVLGHASFVLVERPVQQRRRPRLHLPGAARPAAVASAALLVAGVIGIAVHLPTNDPIADTLRAGEQVVASQALVEVQPTAPATAPATVAPATSTSTAAQPAPTTVTTLRPATTAATAAPRPRPPPTAAPPPAVAALPSGPPPGAVAVTAIGDSVMLSAAGPLKARLGSNSGIDAKVSRQFREGISIVGQLRQQGRLAPVVVVHLGTNGPPTPADVDALVGAAAGARVLFITVRVSRSWTAQTNSVLAAAPARHPNAAVVDWFAHSEGHGDWFHSDGTHLTARGADAYSALAGSALPPPG